MANSSITQKVVCPMRCCNVNMTLYYSTRSSRSVESILYRGGKRAANAGTCTNQSDNGESLRSTETCGIPIYLQLVLTNNQIRLAD